MTFFVMPLHTQVSSLMLFVPIPNGIGGKKGNICIAQWFRLHVVFVRIFYEMGFLFDIELLQIKEPGKYDSCGYTILDVPGYLTYNGNIRHNMFFFFK